jgi:SOS response regulatory protein OraA/RecX
MAKEKLNSEQELLIARSQAKLADYKRTFSSEQGMRVLNDLVASNYLGESTFSKDLHEMAFKEGQRKVVLRILGILGTDPEKIKQMVEESHHGA